MNITDDVLKEANRRTIKTLMIVAITIAILITIFFISQQIFFDLVILSLISVSFYFCYGAIHNHHTLNVLEEKLEKEHQETLLKNQDLISKRIEEYRKTHVKGE
jgi:cation transport ATPase